MGFSAAKGKHRAQRKPRSVAPHTGYRGLINPVAFSEAESTVQLL